MLRLLLSIGLASLATGAPHRKRDGTASPAPVDPAAFFQNYIVIDSSCKLRVTRSNKYPGPDITVPRLRQAVIDAITIAQVAQSIQDTDAAFRKYFLPEDMKVTNENPDEPEEKDIETVKKMYNSMVAGTQKITLRCATTEKELDTCEGNQALTTQDPDLPPTTLICPQFFTDPETTPSLSDKSFDVNGWCTPPPYRLGDLLTGGYVLVHEFTHIPFIATLAGLPPTPAVDQDTQEKKDEEEQ
ncbi:hypothetical protein C8R46DRAFT_1362012 [Mycena filopes]|nr:hypothetical protein C8R46DRAFT_1362012 [Mycena filopes]